MVLKMQRHVAADHCGRCDCSNGWNGIYLKLDGDDFIAMRGKSEFIEETHKAHKGAVYSLFVADPNFDGITFAGKFSLNRVQIAAEIVVGGGALKRKIQVFGVARDGV